MQRKQRLVLLAIALVTALPTLAALLAYYVWQPTRLMNHGELLSPTPLPVEPLPDLAGGEFHLDRLKGKWILLQADSGACDARCRGKLYAMRQVRLAQGKDMGYLERVWLVTDDARPARDLFAEYEGTRIVRAAGSALLAALPAPQDKGAHLYVVDPMGNLMMRFPENPDPLRVIKDLQRLLRPSRIGAG